MKSAAPDPSAAWRALPMVRAWEDNLRSRNWRVDSLSLLNVLSRRDGSPLFALLEAHGTDPEGKPLLPYVLIRGAASVVVPVCVNRGTGARRFLMIRQCRIGDGTMSLEFPAGMVEGADSPADTALRELEEETGLCAEPSALTPLRDGGLCSSPGLSDETVHFYAVEIALDDAAFRAREGAIAGRAGEGEHITTTLKTAAEAFAGITSVLPALALFLHQRRFGGADA